MTHTNRTSISLAVAAAFIITCSSTSRAAVFMQTLGDTTVEYVNPANHGGETSLANFLANYINPATGSASPFLTPDGQPLDLVSQQLQIQRFLVTEEDTQVTLKLLGGQAGYKSIVGVYTWSDADPDPVSTDMLTLHVTPTDTTASFTVQQGQYFGLYLNANGYTSSQGMYYTENALNSDTTSLHTTDHFVSYMTNQGLVFGIEDLGTNSSGVLGDSDYQDFVVQMNFNGMIYTEPTPEPVTILLAAAACVRASGRCSRKTKHP